MHSRKKGKKTRNKLPAGNHSSAQPASWPFTCPSDNSEIRGEQAQHRHKTQLCLHKLKQRSPTPKNTLASSPRFQEGTGEYCSKSHLANAFRLPQLIKARRQSGRKPISTLDSLDNLAGNCCRGDVLQEEGRASNSGNGKLFGLYTACVYIFADLLVCLSTCVSTSVCMDVRMEKNMCACMHLHTSLSSPLFLYLCLLFSASFSFSLSIFSLFF